MVRIDSASSLPPHIQPPIAQVPRAIRETFIFVPDMIVYSIAPFLSRMAGLQPSPLYRHVGFQSDWLAMGEAQRACHERLRLTGKGYVSSRGLCRGRSVDCQESAYRRRRSLFRVAGDSEPLHLVNEGRSLQPKTACGPVGASDHPSRFFQDLQDVLAFDVFEGARTRSRGGHALELGKRGPQRLPRTEDHSALDEILQLANVSGPRVGTKRFDRVVGNTGNLFVH